MIFNWLLSQQILRLSKQIDFQIEKKIQQKETVNLFLLLKFCRVKVKELAVKKTIHRPAPMIVQTVVLKQKLLQKTKLKGKNKRAKKPKHKLILNSTHIVSKK